MLRYSTVLVLVFLLIGCAGMTRIYIPAGTKFVQNKPVTIPTGDAHVMLQFGKITAASKLNRYEPFCRFEVNNLSSTPAQVIEPGTYSVSGVETNMILVMSRNIYNFRTRMHLHDPSDPNIREMACGNWADFSIGDYLSIPQMQQALGSYFKIVTPSS